MNVNRDWLWDRKISLKRAKMILSDPVDPSFLGLSGTLLARKNSPKEVFSYYLKPKDFVKNWAAIKRLMRKDEWNNPRIEFWQAIYEKLKEKFKKRGIIIQREQKQERPMDEICKSIALKIKEARKNKGLTQESLAKKLSISQQIISRIESGKENVSLLTLKKISDGLGTNLSIDIR